MQACRLAVNLMEHRGPDGYGEWVSPSEDVFLGHRRLSIIDLSDLAAQPMIGQSGKVLTYNGEIYNFRSIRDRLESLGRRFRSSGDTEVLLGALETWGVDCLNMLEGMFAFVLWDPAEEEALIVRDFFGVKPLYVFQGANGVPAVASEIKSFYALPDFIPQLNHDMLPEFLRFRCLCREETLLKGVRQMRPGEYLRYCRRTGSLIRVRYWNPSSVLIPQPEESHKDVTQAEFLDFFRETLKRHLIADVPVGTQFSGGVDSSLISAIAVRDLSIRPRGFHCQVEEPAHDESPYAREMAQFLGMETETAALSCACFFSGLLEKLTRHHDEPIMHPNSLGIYLVSRLAHGKVKALLSGEAADEFFAGYSRYPLLLIHQWLRNRPALPGTLKVFAGWFDSGEGRLGTLMNLVSSASHTGIEDRIVSGIGYISGEDLNALLDDPTAERKSVERREALLPADSCADLLTRCQLFDIETYLPSLFLRQDKMSMAASIENRVPFATPGVFSFAMRLRPETRATILSRKTFLKSCLAEYVPGKTARRRKAGFGMPLNIWLGSPEGAERLRSTIGPDSPLHGLINMKPVEELVSGFDGKRSRADTLWTLLSLHVWLNIFCRDRKSVVDFRPVGPHPGPPIETLRHGNGL